MSATSAPTAIAEATFAGGCFWCLEGVFSQLAGIIDVTSGYSNGEHPHPTYEAVCSGTTGHAEVVRIRFDPSAISYTQLLEVFFAIHDPTTLNRQGNDVGSQYRSGIYTHDAQQADAARDFIERLGVASVFPQPIVTEVAPVRNFHAAEAYHQGYYADNPRAGYCAYVITPKVMKVREHFADLLKPQA